MRNDLCYLDQITRGQAFIEKASRIHTGKYSYEHVQYVNQQTKVLITCPLHGDFKQTPNSHTRSGCSTGCPACSGRSVTTESFIKKANLCHKGKYEYDKVVYITARKKVIIGCTQHGEFELTPHKHLGGKGCPSCEFDNLRLTIDEFVNKSRIRHGDRYDYHLVEYKNAHTKIKIICPKHGEFIQEANAHVRGSGCQLCAIRNPEGVYSLKRFNNNLTIRTIPAYFYLIEVSDPHHTVLKIGITKTTIRKRYSHLKNVRIRELLITPGSLYEVFCMEQKILSQFADHRFAPPKHLLDSGRTECFRKYSLLDLCETIDNYLNPTDEL